MSWSSGSWDDPTGVNTDQTPDVGRRRAQVRAALVDLVRTRRTVVDDQERLDGYLRDVCPEEPAEVAVVVVAARSGVPDELSRATEGHAVAAMAARLAGRMHAEFGVDRALARWAVDTWAIALGRMSESQAVDEEAPTAPADGTATAPGPVPDPVAPTSSEADALNAMVARPPVPPAPPPAPAPPQPQPQAQPAPILEEPTRLPPAAGPEPQKTRTRRPAAPAPAAPEAPSRRRNRALAPVAGVTLLAAVALVVALSRGGGTPTATVPPSSSPDTEPAPSTTVTTLAPREFPGNTGALPPGTYKTSTFQPAMAMTVGDSWEVITTERPELLEIGSGPGAIAFVHLTKVFPPSGTYATFREAAAAAEPVPADLTAWLTANPHLSTTRPVSAAITGATGAHLGVTVSSAYPTELCRGDSLPLWPFEDRNLSFGCLAPDDRHRLYALDVSGEKVLVIVVASADSFDGFLREAERVLATLIFTA